MQRVERSIRVDAPPEKAYQYWRDFENFPSFMEHVDEVRKLDAEGRRSHWKLKGPMGVSLEFDAEMTEDRPNQSIGWKSTEGSIGTSGVITFSPVGEQTEVHVLMQWYDPPAGPVGEAFSRLFQNPEKMLEEDLQRFKDIVEGRVGSGLKR